MKLRVLLFVAAVLFPCFCLGRGVSVEPADGWSPASAEQLALLKKETKAEVIDFSICPGAGAANTLYSDAHAPVDKRFAASTVDGYIKAITKAGQVVITREPATVGTLRGYRVVSHKPAKSGTLQITCYLVYSKSGMYSFTIYSGEKQTAPLSLPIRYLARVKISPLAEPADIDRDYVYEMSQKIGLAVLKVGAMGGGIGILLIALIIVIKRRRDATPPPLPL